jgi:hypothetical protein
MVLDSYGELPQKLNPRLAYLIGDPANWAAGRG